VRTIVSAYPLDEFIGLKCVLYPLNILKLQLLIVRPTMIVSVTCQGFMFFGTKLNRNPRKGLCH